MGTAEITTRDLPQGPGPRRDHGPLYIRPSEVQPNARKGPVSSNIRDANVEVEHTENHRKILFSAIFFPAPGKAPIITPLIPLVIPD